MHKIKHKWLQDKGVRENMETRELVEKCRIFFNGNFEENKWVGKIKKQNPNHKTKPKCFWFSKTALGFGSNWKY